VVGKCIEAEHMAKHDTVNHGMIQQNSSAQATQKSQTTLQPTDVNEEIDLARRILASLCGLPKVCTTRKCRRVNRCVGINAHCRDDHIGLLERRLDAKLKIEKSQITQVSPLDQHYGDRQDGGQLNGDQQNEDQWATLLDEESNDELY